jgi:hypothetical protein
VALPPRPLRPRADAGAILHAHSPFATSLACLRRDIPPFHYMIARFGGDSVRCSDYATFGTQALSAAVLRGDWNRRACLLANHGMLVIGRDLSQALALGVELEALCEQYWRACQLGRRYCSMPPRWRRCSTSSPATASSLSIGARSRSTGGHVASQRNPPADRPSAAALPAAVAARLGVEPADIREMSVFRRSHDARKATAAPPSSTASTWRLPTTAASLARFAGDRHLQPTPDMRYRFVGSAPARARDAAGRRRLRPGRHLRRADPGAGGFRPIVLERGKAVRERTQDTWGLWRGKQLDPESNVQFGEGGAGTFSDGKLYSQIKDPRHYGRKVLEEFVKAGAPAEILYVSRPHIGTFRLVGMVERMRREIERLGGEVRFQQRVSGL